MCTPAEVPAEKEVLPTLLLSRPVIAVDSGPQKSRRAPPAAIDIPEETGHGIRVHNTFLGSGPQRSPSLEAVFRERDVISCPSEKIGLLRGLFPEAASASGGSVPASPPPGFRTPSQTDTPPGTWQGQPLFGLASYSHMVSMQTSSSQVFSSGNGSWNVPPMPAHEGSKPVLSLMEALPGLQLQPAATGDGSTSPKETSAYDGALLPGGPAALNDSSASIRNFPEPPSPPSRPAPGSTELPSVGSKDHSSGACKPCAFFYNRGCENGVVCQFCHLCEQGERKRRQKEKVELRRASRKEKKALMEAKEQQ